jgi:rhodanese-related sulfurtransferase
MTETPRRLAVVLAVGFTMMFAACSGPIASPPDTESGEVVAAVGVVTPQQARSLINSHREDPEFVLLDIRTDAEIEAGHIPGAESLDFYGPTFASDLAALDRNGTYLIYCRTGNRTGQTYAMMQDLGFEKVYDLGGGITEWASLGYPVCVGPIESPHVCVGWLEGSNDDS